MATAVSARPSGPHQKLKRPAPPAVQTSSTGTAFHPSPSPSSSSKRLPPGLKHANNSGNNLSPIGTVNVTAARLGNRRRDSQKPGDGLGRHSKGSKSGQGDSSHDERRSRRTSEPFVKTTAYILKKYSKSPPSFILHLHPAHFRFDEQDGTFSYNSPMRALLEHIKSQTVPHDMLDELIAAGIKFYENCLIVQIQDHRSSFPATQTTSNDSSEESNQPFSIHNYNEHLTPSPFVPYPHSRVSEQTSQGPATNGTVPAPANVGSSSQAETQKIKENAVSHKPKGFKIFTTVLFSTPLSLQDEVLKFASMIDHRANHRKQSQANGRAPHSTTVPPTPSSAGFPGPAALGAFSKKQKLLFNRKSLSDLESRLISATAPPLYLEPVENIQQAQKLLNQLKDPLHSEVPAAPKSRKRTIAELAADEALAAEEQRFMLIMDERLVPSSTSSAGGKATTAGGDAGTTSFEARFERFKAIEEIRGLLEEKKQREQEAKVLQQQQQQKLKQEQQDQETIARQQAALEQKAREANARRQEQIQQIQARQQQNQNQQIMHQQQGGQQGPGQHAHPPTTNTIQNTHQLAASQAHHASPIVRHITPKNASSPLIGNSSMVRTGSAVPMSVSNSNQGAGTPPRPGSAIQHVHPAVAMATQRSQQPPSRNGTPIMATGTPRIQQSTPIMHNVTPTPRMSHASPVNPSMAATPVIGHYMMGNPNMNGGHLTLQQQQAIMQQRQQQNAFAQHHQQMQGSPQNNQISPHNLQQLAAHQAHQQAQQRAAPEISYRQQLQSMQQQQMSNIQAGNHGFAGNMPMHQVQMQQTSSHQTGSTPQSQPNKWQQMYQAQAQQILNHLRERALTQYGPQIPASVMQSLRESATSRAKQIVAAKRTQEAYSYRQQQMIGQQMQQGGGNMGAMSGMGGIGGIGGLGSVNGMNGM